MIRTRAILLVGPTGSGKTPLGEMLERRGLRGRRCVHFDFGASLRRAAAGETPPADLTEAEVAFLGDVLESGALLEDEHFPIAATILRAFIDARCLGPEDRLVLNGLPRHAGQARDVDTIVEVAAVVELRCTPEVVFERIRTNAGGDRTDRSDDDADAVREKLDTYARRIAPLVGHYRDAGVPIDVIDVGADTAAEEVWTVLNGSG
ncbi:MAG: nucleoside monophosphate kinase [Planctomycetota bacterium]|jgi:adenylate kinase family enzyme